MNFLFLCNLLLLLGPRIHVCAYRPVILVHGLNSIGSELTHLKKFIVDANPGTEVYIIQYVKYKLETFVQLPLQLNSVIQSIKPIMKTHSDGVHLICHSQGGLLCLAVLEYLPDHNVRSFISLSAPLFGQFGLPDSLVQKVPILKPIRHLSRELATFFLLTRSLQKLVSFANYWKDPWRWQLERYEEVSIYLPVVLNDPYSIFYNETTAAERKRNFLKIDQLILVGGPQDGVIIPWQSAIFGYYVNGTSKTLDIFGQKVFKEDWIGLKTLHETSRLHIYTFENITHGEWHEKKNVFEKTIKPWLD